MKKSNKKIVIISITIALVLIIGGLSIYFSLFHQKEPLTTATVNFGIYLEEGDEVTIEKVKPTSIDKDVEMYAYDFKLSSGQPGGVIEIVIPYDDKGLKDNEELLSVCGKYFNEETNEWEDVFYTVDTQANKVHIITDHLSTYSVFKITDPTKRSAYISDVNVYAAYMTMAKAEAILQTYSEHDATWREDVVGSFLNATGSVEFYTASSVPSLLTLGGAYDEIISSPIGDSLTMLGVTTSCAQFAYDAYNNGLTSRSTSISGMKSVLNLALNFGSNSVQLAYVGVGVIDIALTEVSTFAIDNKYKSTKNMYDAYYNRSGIKRDVKAWREIFENIYKENNANPELALSLMRAEIDNYVNKFWDVASTDWDSWIDSYDKNGKLSKYPWPSSADRTNISNTHKAELYEYLKVLFNSMSRDFYFDSLIEREKDFQKLAAYYNQKFSLVVREDIESGKDSTWGGCYARLTPLSSKTNTSSWTGKLNESGGGRITFTLLAHQTAGFPMTLKLYKTAEDIENGKVLRTIDLKTFTDSEQTIVLQPREVEVIEETTESETTESNNPIVVPTDNPWYDLTIKSSDISNTDAFRGWYAVLAYPENSTPDLDKMYKAFDNKGECLLSFQLSDYEGLESPSHIWLYKSLEDLMAKDKADLIASFSIASGSYSGEYLGEDLYKILIKVKPPVNKDDILNTISGDYTSYMIHSEYIEIYDFMGTPQEMKNIKDFEPGESPSSNVWLHYNGPSLTYKSAADPNNTEWVLDKLSDSRYEIIVKNDGTITSYYVEILTTGENARLTIKTDSDTRKLEQIYILDKIYD